MSDTTDDMEYEYAKIFCKKCEKHIEDCECGDNAELVTTELY